MKKKRQKNKMGKLETPDWIKEGFDSKQKYEKAHGKKTTSKKLGKTFKVKKCPKCGSTEVSVVLRQEEGRGKSDWECKSCKWKGTNIGEKELSEDEFLVHLEKMEGK